MSDAVLKRASRFWDEARQGGRAPTRRDLDLGAAGELVAHLVLAEKANGAGYRRLFEGEAAAALIGGPDGAVKDAWRVGLDTVCATGAPHSTILSGVAGNHVLKALFLPVLSARDDRRVGCVLSVLAVVDDEDA